MKVTTVEYRELFSTGGYTNQTIGLTIQLEEDETPTQAIRRAKAYIDKFKLHKVDAQSYDRALSIVKNPGNHRYSDVEQARATVEAYRKQDDDLTF